MKIGIIVAMGGEFRLVEALLSGKKEQEIRGYRYVTGQLGVSVRYVQLSGLSR